jgi:hypothetical protein
MSRYYVIAPHLWKMIHIPFTPYFWARDPNSKLWCLVEKELREGERSADSDKCKDVYRYRFL